MLGVGILKSQTRNDSLQVSIETGSIISSQKFNSFYLVHNRWGTVSNSQRFFFAGSLDISRQLSENWQVEAKIGFRNENLYQANLGLSWKQFHLNAGRRKRILGGIEQNILTSGSLALGANSLPIPQIDLESDYINFPFSNGIVKVKGGISQGWFENDRYIRSSRLHQKYAKVMIDLEAEIGFRGYGSLIHFAQYGGTSLLGEKQPSGLDDFLKVFFGKGANPSGSGENNGLGNHLGITEFGFDQKIGNYLLQVNYQKPFEDQGSIQPISFKDFLLGIQLVFPDKSKLKKIYFEWVRTMSQSGPGLPDSTDEYPSREDNFGYEIGGRDDYYNNWLYQYGWTYKGSILSNPLFLTYNWALNFLPVFANYENQVINNRIKAFHIGMLYMPKEGLNLRFMFTFSKNYGTYAGLYEGRFAWDGIQTNPDFEYVFLGGKNQFYSLLEMIKETTLFRKPVRFKSMLAVDAGQLYNNTGMELAVEFMLKSY